RSSLPVSWPSDIRLHFHDRHEDMASAVAFIEFEGGERPALAERRVASAGNPVEDLCDLRRLGWLLELLDVLHCCCCCHHRHTFRYRRPRRRVGELSGGVGLREGWIRTEG